MLPVKMELPELKSDPDAVGEPHESGQTGPRAPVLDEPDLSRRTPASMPVRSPRVKQLRFENVPLDKTSTCGNHGSATDKDDSFAPNPRAQPRQRPPLSTETSNTASKNPIRKRFRIFGRYSPVTQGTRKLGYATVASCFAIGIAVVWISMNLLLVFSSDSRFTFSRPELGGSDIVAYPTNDPQRSIDVEDKSVGVRPDLDVWDSEYLKAESDQTETGGQQSWPLLPNLVDFFKSLKKWRQSPDDHNSQREKGLSSLDGPKIDSRAEPDDGPSAGNILTSEHQQDELNSFMAGIKMQKYSAEPETGGSPMGDRLMRKDSRSIRKAVVGVGGVDDGEGEWDSGMDFDEIDSEEIASAEEVSDSTDTTDKEGEEDQNLQVNSLPLSMYISSDGEVVSGGAAVSRAAGRVHQQSLRESRQVGPTGEVVSARSNPKASAKTRIVDGRGAAPGKWNYIPRPAPSDGVNSVASEAIMAQRRKWLANMGNSPFDVSSLSDLEVDLISTSDGALDGAIQLAKSHSQAMGHVVNGRRSEVVSRDGMAVPKMSDGSTGGQRGSGFVSVEDENDSETSMVGLGGGDPRADSFGGGDMTGENQAELTTGRKHLQSDYFSQTDDTRQPGRSEAAALGRLMVRNHIAQMPRPIVGGFGGRQVPAPKRMW